jgi:hypothetical protein
VDRLAPGASDHRGSADVERRSFPETEANWPRIPALSWKLRPGASSSAAAHDPGPAVRTVASGLDNPRGLAFAPNGALFVAEAGRGGAGPCVEGPEGPACFGASGAVTRIKDGKQTRILTGLPSVAGAGGGQAIGPSDVSPHGNGNLYVTVGLGADPASRAQLPPLGAATSGWLVRAKANGGGWTTVADIAGYEGSANPGGGDPDSNPNSVVAAAGGQAVVDAGGNSLVWVSAKGKVSTLATFAPRMVDAPPFLGLPPGTQIPMESVPTAVVRGPDGAYYVGELTGFPFAPGEARVLRVVPGHQPTVVASGFTNIIDLGFDHKGHLYVLELTHNGLLSGDLTGALIRVKHDGSHRVVLTEGLTAPGGLALRDGAAYVSNCSVCPGQGSVLRIKL